jgi:hypothetical protein
LTAIILSQDFYKKRGGAGRRLCRRTEEILWQVLFSPNIKSIFHLPQIKLTFAQTETAYHDMVRYRNMRKQEWDGCPLSAETVMAPLNRKPNWKGPDFCSTVSSSILP